ncbi:MAG: hypothetical protein K2X77_26760 [Candidatus Obscuribacterales bacterium]|jgi:hypothetical protein|nr:hypothetical protein [Candidatus Obscuribacterales bacterium]
MTQDATLIPIGELLTKSGILSAELLSDALNKAKERALPLGKVLVMLGYIKQRDLKAAVEAQSLINDGMVSLEMAATALSVVAKNDVKLPEALGQMGWKKQKQGATNRLGELLVEAEAVTWDQLDEALKTSQETGLPVGRVLVFRKYIANEVLLACLTAQKLIREGVINREQAVQGLKSVRQRQISFEESLQQSGFYRPPARRSTPLGYILVQAGLLDQNQLMTCMELALTNEKPIGEVFIEERLLSRSLLKAAIKVQEMVDNGTLTGQLASQALRQIFSEGCSVVKAIAHACVPRVEARHAALMQELLTLSGLADPKDLAQLLGAGSNASIDIEKELLLSGIVNESMLYALLRGVYLIEQRFLVQEDAIMALHHCQRNNTSMDEALRDLGWTATTRRRA